VIPEFMQQTLISVSADSTLRHWNLKTILEDPSTGTLKFVF
jgi:hypothetical protein